MNPDHMPMNNLPSQEKHKGGHEAMTTKVHDQLFEASKDNEIIKRLMGGEKMQDIMDGVENLEEGYKKKPAKMGCSDERVDVGQEKKEFSEEDRKEPKIGSAGNLILAPKKVVDKFVEDNYDNITQVESHAECGAGAEQWKILQNKNKWDNFKEEYSDYGLIGETVEDEFKNGDALEEWWSKKLSGRFKNATHKHTKIEQMRTGFHDARAIYFNGIDFNPGAIDKMPIGYTCSGPSFKINDAEYLKKELKILSEIAFSNHGFGHRFDENNKFYIFVSAKDQEQLDHLMEVAQEAVNQLDDNEKGKKFSDKIEVQGFIHKVDKPNQ